MRVHPVFSDTGQIESFRIAIADRPESCSMGFISATPELYCFSKNSITGERRGTR
jgi:hypothetical protein